MRVTGRLRNARRVNYGTYECIKGDIYEDALGRFCDGQDITSSVIVAEAGTTVVTLNSLYEVEGWAAGHGPREG